MLYEDSSSKQPKVVVNKIPKSVTDLPFCEDDAGQHQPADDLILFCCALFCFVLIAKGLSCLCGKYAVRKKTVSH